MIAAYCNGGNSNFQISSKHLATGGSGGGVDGSDFGEHFLKSCFVLKISQSILKCEHIHLDSGFWVGLVQCTHPVC